MSKKESIKIELNYSNRIRKLSDSVCSKCQYAEQCDNKIAGAPKFRDIKDNVFGRTDVKNKDCGLWVMFNAEERYAKGQW